MIELRKVNKSYGDIKALNDLDLMIGKGELHGLVGPNGAGKTTSINILTSYLQPDSGEIYYNGNKIENFRLEEKKEIGFIPQDLAIYEDLTAYENLLFWGKLYDLSGRKLKHRIELLLELVGLSSRKNYQVKTFSGGMKRRINLAVGLIHDPEIIFLDEPTVGVDPQSRNFIFELIENMHSEGKTILYTSHYMEEVERLCQKISIIDNGSIIAEGNRDQLLDAIGNESEIIIELDKPIDQNPLKALGDKISFKETSICIQGENIISRLQQYVKIVETSGRKITNLNLHKPNLESVFLKLTGRELRE
jgi:linearmycin/streptolysin S transport system ATP-binding protein